MTPSQVLHFCGSIIYRWKELLEINNKMFDLGQNEFLAPILVKNKPYTSYLNIQNDLQA